MIEKLKKAIEDQQFDCFKMLIKNEEYLLEELRKEEEWNKKLQKQLDIWLEEKCNEKDEDNIKLLLECGASKKEAIKISIINKHIIAFKYLVNTNILEVLQPFLLVCYPFNYLVNTNILEELRKEEDWKEKIQKQLDFWLEEKCNEKDTENIKFLLSCKADEKIIYNQIKRGIDKNNLNVFKYFVEKFKEEGIVLEELIKEEDWKEKIQKQLDIEDNPEKYTEEWKEKLQKQLDIWLEEKCDEKDEDNIKLLLKCGASKKEAIKISIINKHIIAFKYLVNTNILEELRKEEEWNKKLQKQLDIWLEEKCDEKDEGNIKLLLEYGAGKNIIYKQIKDSIENPEFYKFQYFKENFKKYGITLDKIKEEKEWGEKLQKQLDYWLEEKCDEEKTMDIIFLLSCGASKKEAVKISIVNEHIISFKHLVNTNILEELIQEEDWKEKIQKQLDHWLEDKYNEYYPNNEDIKFLLEFGALIEDALKISIEKCHKDSFINLIRTNILSRESIKELKINNKELIEELLTYIYEENGLESRTLENKIMKPDKFDEETKKLIIEVVLKTHLERAKILKIRLNLV